MAKNTKPDFDGGNSIPQEFEALMNKHFTVLEQNILRKRLRSKDRKVRKDARTEILTRLATGELVDIFIRPLVKKTIEKMF